VDWFFILLAITLYGGLPVILFTGWRRWVYRPPVQNRVLLLSLAGFALGTASIMVAIGALLYAGATGGFRYYAPALLTIYKVGLLLSLGGIAFALGGIWKRNALRWHAPVLSFGTFLLWLLWASGE
jgi:uncharacterized integral membrane protein